MTTVQPRNRFKTNKNPNEPTIVFPIRRRIHATMVGRRYMNHWESELMTCVSMGSSSYDSKGVVLRSSNIMEPSAEHHDRLIERKKISITRKWSE
jgi:hypothetical protein